MLKLDNEIKDYFELMINLFLDGNESDYEEGQLIKFEFEEVEKGDLDLYDEDEVELFFKVVKFIEDNGGEVKYKSPWNKNYLDLTFRVDEYDYDGTIRKDIECSFIAEEFFIY